MMKSQLLPPLPPYVDPCNPDIQAWRQAQHEQAIEYLHQTKLDKPSASMLRLTALIATYALGALGLASPGFVAQILSLLLR